MEPIIYVKLDANYLDDPKIASVSSDAELLYVRSLCLSKRLLSDGFIATESVYRYGSDIPTDSLDHEALDWAVKQLVDVGLWEDVEGGYRIAAWGKHNMSKAEVQETRRLKREGGLLGNHRRWHDDEPSPDCRYCRNTDSVVRSDSESTETETETETETTSIPPSADDKSSSTKSGRKKAVPLPDSWEPNDQHRQQAREDRLDVDREAAKFRDHAIANGRTQRDWDASFRNWLRKAVDMGVGASPQKSSPKACGECNQFRGHRFDCPEYEAGRREAS